MSYYTLSELIDYALRYPEIGAVNFNTLHVALKFLISKCGLNNEVVYLPPPGLEEGFETPFGIENRQLMRDDDDTNEILDLRHLSNRTDEIEDKLNEIIDVVKKLKPKRVKYDKGEKREISEDDKEINREEFEMAFEDLGEAIARVGIQMKTQKENLDKAVKEGTLREMCYKVVEEKFSKYEECVNGALKELALAVRKLQRLFKEVIYPEAAGITKCVSCGRKAQIPLIELIRCSGKASSTNKEFYGKPDKFSVTKDKTNHGLKFTVLSLNKLQREKTIDKLHKSEDDVEKEQGENVPHEIQFQRNLSTSLRATLDPIYDVQELSSIFVPLRLRRNYDTPKFHDRHLHIDDRNLKGIQVSLQEGNTYVKM